MSNQAPENMHQINLHQISFSADGISVEQEIEIRNKYGTGTNLSIDEIVSGLNNGSLTPSLNFNMNPEHDGFGPSWIRDSQGKGVAVVLVQRVSVGNYKDFEGPSTSNEEPSDE